MLQSPGCGSARISSWTRVVTSSAGPFASVCISFSGAASVLLSEICLNMGGNTVETNPCTTGILKFFGDLVCALNVVCGPTHTSNYTQCLASRFRICKHFFVSYACQIAMDIPLCYVLWLNKVEIFSVNLHSCDCV